MSSWWRNCAAAVAGVAVMAAAAAAQAMTVQPVALNLSMTGRNASQPVRVENNGPNPLPVEVRVVETDFTPDGVRASSRPTDDVLVTPPQAIIAPGATQVFRVQYVGEPDAAHSRHFYAEVAQQAVQLPAGQSAIQILYNFQVMVNVASPTAGDPNLTISDPAIVENADHHPVVAFTVTNSGGNYGYLSNGSLRIRQVGPDGRELFNRTMAANDIQQQIGFGLVGPQMNRRFVTPIVLESNQGRLEVTFSPERGR